jgi:hypothetical protein
VEEVSINGASMFSSPGGDQDPAAKPPLDFKYTPLGVLVVVSLPALTIVAVAVGFWISQGFDGGILFGLCYAFGLIAIGLVQYVLRIRAKRRRSSQ